MEMGLVLADNSLVREVLFVHVFVIFVNSINRN